MHPTGILLGIRREFHSPRKSTGIPLESKRNLKEFPRILRTKLGDKKQQVNKDACLHSQCTYHWILGRNKQTKNMNKRKKRMRNSTGFLRNSRGFLKEFPENSSEFQGKSIEFQWNFKEFLWNSRDCYSAFQKDFQRISKAIALELRKCFMNSSGIPRNSIAS